MPCALGGMGLTSATVTRHAAHYASWAASWAHIHRTFSLPDIDLSMCPAPFAVGLRAAHTRVEAAFTAASDNMNGHPLPHAASKISDVPDPSDLSSPIPHAQKRFAAVVHSARWLDLFHGASEPHRAVMLSAAQQGSQFAFTAVPSPRCRHAMLPLAYITAMQLRLRLPLSLLAGVTRCKCGCAIDPYGDHLFSCPSLLELRTPWHDLIQHVVTDMLKCANYRVSIDSHRDRAVSMAYSPHYRPDLTALHGNDDGSHMIIDITTTSVVKQGALPGSARRPLVASEGAASSKEGLYGDVTPHTMLPFVVESAGALGKEATRLFQTCRRRARNQLAPQRDEVSTWSARGFSNFYLQSLSVANLRGIGHFLMAAATTLRGA